MNFGFGDTVCVPGIGEARVICSYCTQSGQTFHFGHLQSAGNCVGALVFLDDDSRISLAKSAGAFSLLIALASDSDSPDEQVRLFYPIEAAVEGQPELRAFLLRTAQGQYEGLGDEIAAHLASKIGH